MCGGQRSLTFELTTATFVIETRYVIMLGSLVALANDSGVKLGEHFEIPLLTKCVITDGIEFTLMCYQLNIRYLLRKIQG